MDELLSQREKLNLKLQTALDQHTGPWGVKVALVEVKQVDLPEQMIRAIASQAEAERERRAKIIHAEGEAEAAVKLEWPRRSFAHSPPPSSFAICRRWWKSDRRRTQRLCFRCQWIYSLL